MKKNETKYSLEEREWLIAHKDMPRKDLVTAFNARFGRSQTLGALSTFMGKKLGITRKDYHLPCIHSALLHPQGDSQSL